MTRFRRVTLSPASLLPWPERVEAFQMTYSVRYNASDWPPWLAAAWRSGAVQPLDREGHDQGSPGSGGGKLVVRTTAPIVVEWGDWIAIDEACASLYVVPGERMERLYQPCAWQHAGGVQIDHQVRRSDPGFVDVEIRATWPNRERASTVIRLVPYRQRYVTITSEARGFEGIYDNLQKRRLTIQEVRELLGKIPQ